MKDRFGRFVLLAGLAAAHGAHAQGTVQDAYGPIVEWQQSSGFEVTPIHVGLLPDGDLFFLNEFNFLFYPGTSPRTPGFQPEFVFRMRPTPAGSTPPAAVLVQPTPSPPSLRPLLDGNTGRFRSLVCGGHALMADGNLFFASGSDTLVDLARYDGGDILGSLKIDGLTETYTYDPLTGAWVENPGLIARGPLTGEPRRWYATVTRLADSRMLVTGGYEKVLPSQAYNPSVEVFDPAANAWAVVSGTQDTPRGIENPDYTHVFQFPNARQPGSVMVIGGSGEPMYLSLTGKSPLWQRTGRYRPGAKEFIDASAPQQVFPNHGSSSALLPMRLPEDGWGYSNGSVAIVAGAHHTPMASRVDVYDPATDAWRAPIETSGPRHHPSTVLLPDGRLLILAGYDDESPVSQTGFAEYVDPRNNFAMSKGSARMPEVRGYHTVTALLPDGRVLVGGGNVDDRDAREQSNFRYYSPDYMFKPRPQFTLAQDSMALGGRSVISVPHQTVVAEAALVGLASMTHSYDMNQRHVQVRVTNMHITLKSVSGRSMPASAQECAGTPDLCSDLYAVDAPTSAETTPPGHYMLFILDGGRVPSTGRIVRLWTPPGRGPAT